jgi:hypothetical protein
VAELIAVFGLQALAQFPAHHSAAVPLLCRFLHPRTEGLIGRRASILFVEFGGNLSEVRSLPIWDNVVLYEIDPIFRAFGSK